MRKSSKTRRMVEEHMMDDAEYVHRRLWHHRAHRPHRHAQGARDRGIKAGLIRPITLWPFPERGRLHARRRSGEGLPDAWRCRIGQMVDDVRLAVNGAKPVEFYRPHGRHDSHAVGEIARADSSSSKEGGISMAMVFEKTKMLDGRARSTIARAAPMASSTGWWPRRIDELGVQDKTIGVAPVGCAVFAYNYFNCDMYGGRPRPCAGGGHGLLSACIRTSCVFTYQGDGDLASIGAAEIVHAAHARREDHRDLHQQRHLRHDRRPDGPHLADRPEDHHLALWPRSQELNGNPIRMSEMLATLDGPAYIERVSRARCEARHGRQEGHQKGV